MTMTHDEKKRYLELCHEQAAVQDELHHQDVKSKRGGIDVKKIKRTRAQLGKVNAKLVEFALELICR